MEGEERVNYKGENLGEVGIEKVMEGDGKEVVMEVGYGESFVVDGNVWKGSVGGMGVYVVDRENEVKREFEGGMSEDVYGGEWENGVKEEIVVGIGGMMRVKGLGIRKDVYECNEGDGGLMNMEGVCD